MNKLGYKMGDYFDIALELTSNARDNYRVKRNCSRCDAKLMTWGLNSHRITTKNDPEELCEKCYKVFWQSAYGGRDGSATQVTVSKVKEVSGQMNFEDLVAAQNRTTHAVRSLAITFVAAPIIALLVICGLLLAYNSGNTGLMIFVGIVGLLISIGTLVKAIEELTLSKI